MWMWFEMCRIMHHRQMIKLCPTNSMDTYMNNSCFIDRLKDKWSFGSKNCRKAPTQVSSFSFKNEFPGHMAGFSQCMSLLVSDTIETIEKDNWNPHWHHPIATFKCPQYSYAFHNLCAHKIKRITFMFSFSFHNTS